MSELSPVPAPPEPLAATPPVEPASAPTRSDLVLVFLRSFLLQSAWNFERGLNYGFAFALAPILRRIYLQGERPGSFHRHLEYFNTQPYLACFILGAVASMETELAASPEGERQRRAEEIHALKVGMMGPVAAMGDSLFWAAYRPFCVILVATLAYSGALPSGGYTVTVPILFLLVFNAGHLSIRTLGFVQGWRQGDQVVLNLRRYGFQEAAQSFKLVATLVLGVLVVLLNRRQLDISGEITGFILKMAFFGAILAINTFALRKKIGASRVFYAVVLFALMLAYWPKLSGETGAGTGFFPFLDMP